MLTGRRREAIKMKILRFLAMSEEQLSALLAKLKKDTGPQKKPKVTADLDAAAALTAGTRLDASKADWLAAKQNILVVDESDLAGVAGGSEDGIPEAAWNSL